MTRIPNRDGIDQIWDAIRKLQVDAQKRRGSVQVITNSPLASMVGDIGVSTVDQARLLAEVATQLAEQANQLLEVAEQLTDQITINESVSDRLDALEAAP